MCFQELNEHDLEERLYAMLHHVDETQNNVNQTNQIDATQLFENGSRGTISRYWRTSNENNPHVKVNTPNPYVKVNTTNPHVKINATNPHVQVSTTNPQLRINTPKPPTPVINNTISKPVNTKPKEEKSISPTPATTVDLSIFQSPIPQNVKKVIEIIEHEDNNQVLLESSDEDEVVEVALPPKPTITIESSDEDELSIIKSDPASKTPTKQTDKSKNVDRAISASPVPSVVSSVSDDFIRGDCIALNISSRQPDNPSFDFSLHGPDLIVLDAPAKKKRKRKNKDAVTSTPIAAEKSANQSEECFATPKSKAKNKKKTKSNAMIQKSVSAPDMYDSDSDQSIIGITKSKSSYIVTEKSLPSADVYESDSNQSEVQIQVKQTNTTQTKDTTICNSSVDKDNRNPKRTNDKSNSELYETCEAIVDLTDNDSFITIDNTDITESLVMANVTGFMESEDYGDENQTPRNADNISKYVSSKVPSILNADLDFDNLKGNDRVCKKRRYSLTTLRAEMEKFYNESWGGEDFNHREIQKNMSRDKNLWAIDPKDRTPSYNQRKTRCNYCNRVGHRDDSCMRKPARVKLSKTKLYLVILKCFQCGSPNHMFTNICRNCSTWGHITCAECKQNGHPSSHCPDLWRRYHNTIDITMPLEKCFQTKQWAQLYCSGCSRRGHLIHSCRTTVPFESHPINTPYVCVYRPLYCARNQDYSTNKQFISKHFSQDAAISSATPNRGDGNKRMSKSPTLHDNHSNKKRNMSAGDEAKTGQLAKSPVNNSRQNPPLKEVEGAVYKEPSKSSLVVSKEVVSEKAPDFIAIGSSNHDNKGHVIQDNEVSDTSEVVTSARIYVTNDVFDKIQTKEQQDWLKETTKKLDVTVQCCGGAFPFLSIKGKVGDQESFQYLLRERKWNGDNSEDKPSKANNEAYEPEESAVEIVAHNNLPKNRYNLLRHLTKALDSLKQDLGDPKAMHKELTFLQNRHDKLLKQKVINPTVLSHSRTNINNMLKKLNTILLGQAGLANGSNSVNELYSYKEKLSTFRGNTISMALRRDIGKHFHSIFSPNAREDYSELLKKYDLSKPTVKLAKRKKKDKSFMPSPKLKKLTSIPSQEDNGQNTGPGVQNNTQKSIQMKKLMFYHQRIRKAKPKGTVHKKTKVELVRKLHTYMASMFQRQKLSSKALKKVKKAQEEAQNFLSAI
ncbi:Zinc finger CCHC domain-containing protein 7 [Operophtera brumata]|uniref:Zinc finger CCHC domain-containing protein 7 n=1 Tax=Operophtera brumata TaxID=104452 RepID=A0A0L7L9Z7_OPEBR|nr:Zinc finger CCHC domain-containing protein 7 [Operophtera brumata]